MHQGKAVCPAKQVPEETLTAVAAEVLGLAEFDEAMFKNRISEIRIPGDNRLVFVFYGGKTEERTWQDRSRRESWTDEKRLQARNCSLQQFHGEATV